MSWLWTFINPKRITKLGIGYWLDLTLNARLQHVSVEPCVEFHSMNIIIGVYVALMIMNGIIMGLYTKLLLSSKYDKNRGCCRGGLRNGDRLGNRVCVLQHHHHLDHLLLLPLAPGSASMEYVWQSMEYTKVLHSRGKYQSYTFVGAVVPSI